VKAAAEPSRRACVAPSGAQPRPHGYRAHASSILGSLYPSLVSRSPSFCSRVAKRPSIDAERRAPLQRPQRRSPARRARLPPSLSVPVLAIGDLRPSGQTRLRSIGVHRAPPAEKVEHTPVVKPRTSKSGTNRIGPSGDGSANQTKSKCRPPARGLDTTGPVVVKRRKLRPGHP
jgi:hypothetical protein